MAEETDQTSTKFSGIDIGYRRGRMAELLSTALATTRKIEQRLAVSGGWSEARGQVDVATVPGAKCRFEVALLLRKARIHTTAVLRANETSNLHSLAVQMRPALECVGQIVFSVYYHELAPGFSIAREHAVQAIGDRVDADHYHWFLRRTKGGISAAELRKMEVQAREDAATDARAPKPKKNKSRRFRVEDRVRPLQGGPRWYRYLSEHFSHGKTAKWRGFSWRGGVVGRRVEDEVAFMGSMDYLAEQVALMNAHAACCHVSEDKDDRWDRWIEPALAQLHDIRRESHVLRSVETAKTREASGGARAD